MNDKERIEEFLKLIRIISKNDIITNNLVYANVTRLGTDVKKTIEIDNNFNKWINDFKDRENIKVFVDPECSYFCQFTNYTGNESYDKMIKMYIPVNDEYIYETANKIFNYMANNNIKHASMIGSHVRMDDIVIRVFNMEDALKIQKFIMNDKYIKDGLMKPNPFTYGNGMISYAWDGHLSFNMVLSSYVAGYINYLKSMNKLDNVNYQDFINYINNVISKLDKPSLLNNLKIDIDEDSAYNISDYEKISKMLLKGLTSKDKDVDDFYYNYNRIVLGYTYDLDDTAYIKSCQVVFDNIYKLMVEMYGYESTDKRITSFMISNNYNYFTRKNNIRKFMVDNKISPKVLLMLLSNMKEKIEHEKILEGATYNTYNKYDYEQTKTAIEEAIKGNYKYFTNEMNDRTRMNNIINKDEIKGLIIYTLLRNGYSVNDVISFDNTLIDKYIDNIIDNKKINKHR